MLNGVSSLLSTEKSPGDSGEATSQGLSTAREPVHTKANELCAHSLLYSLPTSSSFLFLSVTKADVSFGHKYI